ncbi:MAG: hypothetical protein IJ062_05650 [Firmicutes bacterium]|nr:hypothetical protein [Bacillota bacterium]
MKFNESTIDRICDGLTNERFKNEINCCETAEMAEIYIAGVNYLCTDDRLILLFCGGIELSSIKLIESLTEEILDNPPLADLLVKKINKLKDVNILSKVFDTELLLSVGELYETILMYKYDTYIYEQTRKLYAKLKTGRTIPFFCKVKKVGSKAYHFANFEVKGLRAELENLLEECEKRGTKEDLAYCHFYLGLFLYKQPDFNEGAVYFHFSESRNLCPLASAPFISEFIEKHYDGFDDDIDPICGCSIAEDYDEYDKSPHAEYSAVGELLKRYPEKAIDFKMIGLEGAVEDVPFDEQDDFVYNNSEDDIYVPEKIEPLIKWNVPQ